MTFFLPPPPFASPAGFGSATLKIFFFFRCEHQGKEESAEREGESEGAGQEGRGGGGGTRSPRWGSQSAGHRIAWKVAAGSEAPPPPSGVRFVWPLLRELLPPPPPGPTTAPRTPVATEEVGSVDRHGPLELSRRRGAPRPPSPRSVRPGKAGGGKKKVNQKKERRGPKGGSQRSPRVSCPLTAQATAPRKVQGQLAPILRPVFARP